MSTSKKDSSHKSPVLDATDRSLDNLLMTLKTTKVDAIHEASVLECVEEQVEVRSESFVDDYPRPPEPPVKAQTPQRGGKRRDSRDVAASADKLLDSGMGQSLQFNLTERASQEEIPGDLGDKSLSQQIVRPEIREDNLVLSVDSEVARGSPPDTSGKKSSPGRRNAIPMLPVPVEPEMVVIEEKSSPAATDRIMSA